MTRTLNKTSVKRNTKPILKKRRSKSTPATNRPTTRKSDYGTPDDQMPEITPEQFTQALALRNRHLNAPAKQRITIMLDQDIVEFFKQDGEGYQTRINEALLRHMMRVKAGTRGSQPADIFNRLRVELNQLEESITQRK